MFVLSPKNPKNRIIPGPPSRAGQLTACSPTMALISSSAELILCRRCLSDIIFRLLRSRRGRSGSMAPSEASLGLEHAEMYTML